MVSKLLQSYSPVTGSMPMSAEAASTGWAGNPALLQFEAKRPYHVASASEAA